MSCHECGQAVSETAQVCDNCGASVGKGTPVQSPGVNPAVSAPDTTHSRQETKVTLQQHRFVAVIALIGCAVAFAGIFTPWLAVTSRASAWDCLIGREYAENGFTLYSLHPPYYLWLVPVGTFAAFVGAVFTVVLPRMKAPWFAILVGAVAAIVGAICAFPGREWYVSHCLCIFHATYQYGVFLTLAGSVVGALGGLLGLFPATQVHGREAPPRP